MTYRHLFHGEDRVFAAPNWDMVYRAILERIMKSGDTFVGRNGETKSLFGTSTTVDLSVGFPLTRLRKMPVKNLFREFLFDIGFEQNVNALGPAKHFWDFLADENGDLGATAYNRQWRMWPPSARGSEVANEELHNVEVDQLQKTIYKLRRSSNSRHGTVITHNPTAVNPACPPCHIGLQFMPRPNGSLDLMVPARSNDMIVGFPLDIARYAILTHVMAKAVDMKPGRVYMPSANSHVYANCYEIAETLMTRTPKNECLLSLSSEWDARAEKPLELLKLEHFSLIGYEAHEAMQVEVN
ncbi:MAG: hypothetical protein EB168_08955 [Euryarchaeota archaeon]|nr:hypothetical protein [Euryarchaeota archaeon]